MKLDSAHFDGSVSEDLNSPDRVLRPIKNYTVGKARYYELVVPKTNLDWSLLKKRYGFSLSSARLSQRNSAFWDSAEPKGAVMAFHLSSANYRPALILIATTQGKTNRLVKNEATLLQPVVRRLHPYNSRNEEGFKASGQW